MTPEFLNDLRAASQPLRDFGTMGLYFLFDGEELVYIGTSNYCENRIRQHHQRGHIKFDSYTIIEHILSRSDRERVEAKLIRAYRPKGNLNDMCLRHGADRKGFSHLENNSTNSAFSS